MLEATLALFPGTTFGELRRFVTLTSQASDDDEIGLDYDERAELTGIIGPINDHSNDETA